MDQVHDSRMRSTRRRDCEPPLPEPLAYFLTWPTYGTWLPGDERGWVEYQGLRTTFSGPTHHFFLRF